MTDREIEKTYKKMTESEAPDLWRRIEGNLSERKMTEKEAEPVKRTFFSKIRQVLFGGGAVRTAVTICLMCLVVFGVVQSAGGAFRMGESKGSNGTEDMAAQEAGNAAAMGAADGGMMEYAEEKGELTSDESSGTGAAAAETGRKLIRNIYLDVETLDFDTLVAELQDQTERLGGYVEYSSVSGSSYYYDSTRYADLTLRIPKDKTDEFLEQIGDAANITSRSENVEDITLTYVDTESHVKALRTEEEQLLKILEKAETVEDIMSIQSRLSEVRYQLESYTSQLKIYDNQVDYDTVTINIREVTKETPTEKLSIWQQMKNGFADSLTAITEGARDLCIWIVANIPYFAVLFVVVLVITVIIKKGRKKKKNTN